MNFGMENNRDSQILSNLPLDVLQMIFTLLPLPMIFRLRVLSKEWNQLVTTCGGARNPKRPSAPLFAIVSDGGKNDQGRFHIRAFDIMYNQWHILHPITAMDGRRFHHLTACDGGLVCFVSQVQHGKELEIVVCNPLTREKRVLPRSNVYYQVQPKMVKLIVNRHSNDYEVILAGSKGASFKAEVYNSRSGAWSAIQNSATDCVIGYHYSRINASWVKVPMAVDCRAGQKVQLSDTPWIGNSTSDPVKDHLELRKNCAAGSWPNSTIRCPTAEFRCRREDNPGWVNLRPRDPILATCFVGGEFVDHYDSIYACMGFFLVIGEQFVVGERLTDVTFIYDLWTRSCYKISNVPERENYDKRHSLLRGVTERNHWPKTIMCELRWDVVP